MTEPISQQESLERALHLLKAGELPGAEALCHAILGEDPASPDAHHLLSYVHAQRGDAGRAMAAITRAIEGAPDRPDLRMRLATILMNDGQYANAADAFAEAARLRPGWLQAVANRGIALARLKRYPEAEPVLREALRIDPHSELVLTTLAGTLHALGRSAEAADTARRAVAANPDAPEAWLHLGLALHSLGRLDDAAHACERAIAERPGFAMAWYNLGHVRNDQWRAADARAHFARAVELDPGYLPAWHAMLFNMLYDPAGTEQTIFEAHARFGREFTAGIKAPPGPATGNRARGRSPDRMRVGYLSPDFRAHSCAAFLRPLFAAHDRTTVELFAYSVVERPDAETDWFRSQAEHWRNIRGLSDAQSAAIVRDDGIDILVDLAGHTLDQPLGVFALAPAPVQLAWLGYPATSGLTQIGFRLTDEEADPPGESDRRHTERLVRLKGGFLCYRAPEDAPGVGLPPASRNGYPTFGSFNNLAKVTPDVVAAWARILLAVPDSRLVLKGRLLAHEDARSALYAAFEMAGVPAARLELRNWIPLDENPLAAYHGVDVALDTFPYNGTTTTFEALWMGVPVITLRGGRHSARVGASILAHTGRRDWIAHTTDEYVALAVQLAADLPQLVRQRQVLRGTLGGSSLADANGFARRLEAVYRDLLAGPAGTR